jgi:glycosyltransferase involved in cell wall biosynthesis
MKLRRLLFASCHCYLDPSSGAALATRDVLELLSERGIDCRALTGGLLDFEQETAIEQVFNTLGVAPAFAVAPITGGVDADLFDFEYNRVRVTTIPFGSSLAQKSPTLDEANCYLALTEQAFDRFRPQVLLTYGGHPADLELMRRAKLRGIAVVFHLHNFAYDDRRAFENTVAILVPSEYSRRFYNRRLGVNCTVIPYPLRPKRVVAEHSEPTYLTFINPQPTKGSTVFARIASEIATRRPGIPILVVEGRAQADGLANAGLDLSGLTNLNRMANTSDPRQFYRVSRALLLPSLWRESFGRVAAEAMANKIPVLASDRGALPEVLGDAGFVFTIPARCTPASGAVPTAREVAPWVAVIERLWHDSEWENKHRKAAFAAARRWDEQRLADEYVTAFERMT